MQAARSNPAGPLLENQATWRMKRHKKTATAKPGGSANALAVFIMRPQAVVQTRRKGNRASTGGTCQARDGPRSGVLVGRRQAGRDIAAYGAGQGFQILGEKVIGILDHPVIDFDGTLAR